MSLHGFNRAALNSGVSGIIAGAALVVASASFAAEGVREVRPASLFAVNNISTASASRNAFGESGFITVSQVTASPVLLQLQSANIVVSGGLHSTPTETWAHVSSTAFATAFKTQNAHALSLGVVLVTAESFAKAGFASNIDVRSTFAVDPSIKLTGQTTWQREGYATSSPVFAASVVSLKSARGFANSAVTSSATTDSIKTHGGKASSVATWQTLVVPSTDSVRILGLSSLIATGLLTAQTTSVSGSTFGVTAAGTLTTFGAPYAFSSTLQTAATPRLALLGGGTCTVLSTATSLGARVHLGYSVSLGEAAITAQWSRLIASSVLVSGQSAVTSLAFTNAEAPDPEERTMYRPATERTMVRPFIDRTMRRVS